MTDKQTIIEELTRKIDYYRSQGNVKAMDICWWLRAELILNRLPALRDKAN